MKKKIQVLLPDDPFCESCCGMQFPTIIIHDGNTTWCLGCSECNELIDQELVDQLRAFENIAETLFSVTRKNINEDFLALKKTLKLGKIYK